MNFKLSDAKNLPLKVSVWIVDDNRYNDLLNLKPNSFIWSFTAMIWVCYLNACRAERKEPETSVEDVEFKVEEMLSTKAGKAELIALTSKITEEMKIFTSDDDAEEKKIQVKTKKRIGRK